MADASNIKIEEQINKMLKDRTAMLQAQSREMQSQLQFALQIKAIFSDAKAEDLIKDLDEAQKAFDSIATKAKAAGDASNGAMEAISQGAEKAATSANKVQLQTKLLQAKFPSLKTVGVAALSGLSQGFTNLLALGKGFSGVLESSVGFIFNIGKAILSIPLNIFRNLVDMAGSMGGDTSLAQAFEDLRKDFGSFKQDVSKNVIGGFQEIQKGFTGTGLSAYKVLGSLANQLKYFHEIAKGAGAQMHQFGAEVAKNAGLIAGMEKGLGVGADNIKAYMDKATISGKSLTKTMLDTANYSLQMGEAFGMSQKVLAKDITMMMKDVKNFGSLTQKEMSVAAVYTRKLGLEVKDLLGTIDKFDTFEDAANNAAQLSQAFGGSVDAFKMMNEQDPAKRLDMLRESMKAAGKTSENMSRQELKLLENTTGLSAETAKLAFASKNQGLTYDQVRKQSEKAEKKQLTQAEAMSKLADSIERVIQSGETMKGGFLDQFIEGFERGIKWSKPFMTLMINLRQALYATKMAGFEVGKAFVKMFPGVEQMLSTLASMFSKGKFDSLLGNVKASFLEFFTTLDTGKLMENLRRGFFSFFDSNSENGSKFIAGVKAFFTAFSKIAATGLKYVVENFTKGLQGITEFIKDPSAYLEKLKSGASGASGWIGMFQPLFDLFKDKKLWNDLKDAGIGLLKVVWHQITEWIHSDGFQKIAGKIIPAAIGVILAPAISRVALTMGLETFVKGFTGKLGGAAKDVAAGAANAGKAAGINPASGGVFSSLLGNPYVAAGAAVAAIAVIGAGMSHGLKKFGKKLEEDVTVIGDSTDKAFGASSAGIIQLLSFGSISDAAAQEMGKNLSKLSNDIFKKITDLFGDIFSSRLKKQFEIVMSTFVDVSDLFTSLFTFDIGGVIKSLGKLLWDIIRGAANMMMGLLVELPTAIVDKLATVFEDVATGIDNLFKDGSGEEMMQKMITGMEEFFSKNEFPDVGAAVIKALQVVFTKLLPALAHLGQSLMIAIAHGLWGNIKANFAGPGAKAFFDSIEEIFDKVKKFFLTGFKEIGDAVKGVMGDLFPKSADEKLKTLTSKLNKAATATKPIQQGTDEATRNPESPALAGADSDMNKAAAKEADKAAGLDSKLSSAKMTLDMTKELTEQLKKFDIQTAVNDITQSIGKIDFSSMDTKMIESFGSLSRTIEDFVKGLGGAVKFSEKKVYDVLGVTRDIIKSVQELNNVLGSGDATKIKLTENLKKFADNSGLGKSGSYKIENSGIVMHVHFEVKMNAAEVEEAIVLRHDSIIKDGIRGASGLSEQENNKLKPYL